MVIPVAFPARDLRRRAVIFLACGWMLGSWLLALGLDSAPVASRWMVFGCLFGLLLIWPAIRLSQGTARDRCSRADLGVVFADWVKLGLLLQLVIWPLWLSAEWRPRQALWLSGGLLAWSLLAGAILAWGRAGGGARRTLAMILCLALLLAEPALMGLLSAGGGPTGWVMRVSPLEMAWTLTASGGWEWTDFWRQRITWVFVAAALAWIAMASGRRGAPPPARAKIT